jgi:hypothetical protein
MKFRISKDNFLPHQREWWDLPNFIKLLVGGYGCGKTYIGALRAIYLSYVNSGKPGQYVSPSYAMARKTIIPTIKEIATRSGFELVHNKTYHEFIIPNWDGLFWVGSGDDPDSLRGPNLAWAGIDEPFIQSKDVLDQMMARIRPIGEHSELFLTGTPEELNWGYDIAQNDGGRYDIGYIRGKTRNNPYVGEEYYDNLYAAYTPEMRAAYLDGEFINLRLGRAYKPFERSRHLVDREIKREDGQFAFEIGAGLDFNVDYMSAEIFVHGNGWLHFFDEIRLSNSNSFELADALFAKHPGIKVYPDATGALRKSSSSKSDHQIFKDRGFRIYARPSNPDLMDRVNAVNSMLINDRITIKPGTCEWLIKDLERVVFKSGDLDKRSDLALTHASDGAGYAVAYLYPVRQRTAWVG